MPSRWRSERPIAGDSDLDCDQDARLRRDPEWWPAANFLTRCILESRQHGSLRAARRAEKETIGIWLSAVLETPPLGLAGAKTLNHGNTIMSQHRSLRVGGATAAKRNVLKRFERVEVLKKRGQWKDGDRVTGLRKTKPE